MFANNKKCLYIFFYFLFFFSFFSSFFSFFSSFFSFFFFFLVFFFFFFFFSSKHYIKIKYWVKIYTSKSIQYNCHKFLELFTDVAFLTVVGSAFQCSGTLSEKKFFLTSRLALCWSQSQSRLGKKSGAGAAWKKNREPETEPLKNLLAPQPCFFDLLMTSNTF